MKKFFNILLTFTIGALCVSCSGVDYMNRQSYSELRTSQGVQSFIPSKLDNKKVREYGGVIIKPSTITEAADLNANSQVEEDNYYVAFKREKKRLYAETLLFKSDNEQKTIVDQTFFDMGFDRKTKGLSFNLTLKY